MKAIATAHSQDPQAWINGLERTIDDLSPDEVGYAHSNLTLLQTELRKRALAKQDKKKKQSDRPQNQDVGQVSAVEFDVKVEAQKRETSGQTRLRLFLRNKSQDVGRFTDPRDAGLFGASLEVALPKSVWQAIIFVNRLQEFSLGGLKTFFEQRLDQAFKSLLEEREDCMFDPYCEETLGAACAGCLHLPEVVCRLFNNALSRILLYGGDLSTEIEGDGSERTLWKNPNLRSFTQKDAFIGFWDRHLD